MIKEKKTRDKKINSKDKGDRLERSICNKMKKAWGVTAYRTPGSGAYTKRNVSKAMKEAAIGDVVIEEFPEFIIECKNYYSLHLTNWFKSKSNEQSIYNFWKKLEDEAIKFRKIPLLICKEDNSPIVVVTSLDVANIVKDYTGKFDNFFSMTKNNNHLVIFALDELLSLDLDRIRLIISSIIMN